VYHPFATFTWRTLCEQIASGFRGAISVGVMAYSLLLFVPLSVAVRYLVDAPPTWVFLTSVVAIAVLADWIRRATEQLAERAGSTIGGLLNVSFGNTAELVLALFILSRAQIRVVQAQITGSIIGTTLLFLGVSALVGGIGRPGRPSTRRTPGCCRHCCSWWSSPFCCRRCSTSPNALPDVGWTSL
jgi:hypothetical protein